MTDAPKKQHWLKFYSSDYRSDVTLGPCSLAARGLWMEMLCIMSEANPRGSLVKDGQPYTAKRLAALARAPIDEIESLLEELEQEGVFSRDPDGTIYSRRMRRDILKAQKDKENGSTGGNPKLNADDYRGVNPTDKAIEARSQNPDSSLREQKRAAAERDFEEAWALYPKREGHNPKKTAHDKFVRLVLAGEDPAVIKAGIVAYARARDGENPKFTKQTVAFLHQRAWEDDHTPAAAQPRAGPPWQRGPSVADLSHMDEPGFFPDEPRDQPRYSAPERPPAGYPDRSEYAGRLSLEDPERVRRRAVVDH